MSRRDHHLQHCGAARAAQEAEAERDRLAETLRLRSEALGRVATENERLRVRLLEVTDQRDELGAERNGQRIAAGLDDLVGIGVLREERAAIACPGCGRTPCLARCSVSDDRRVKRRFVTQWEEVSGE